MKNIRKLKRQTRTRKKLGITNDRPRLTVFRSNRYIYAQIIDDKKGKTIIGVSEKQLEVNKKDQKINSAKALGNLIAKKAIDLKIKEVVFDKGSYAYHGRVKSLADGAREGGLIF